MPGSPVGAGGRTVVYARVSSHDQRADLDRQVSRVMAWTTAQRLPVEEVVTEVGSGLNGRRPVGSADRVAEAGERVLVVAEIA